MGLKKLFKKARKALGIPAITLGNVAKVGAAVATGGIGAGALALGGKALLKSKLKSAAVGGIKQVIRTKADKTLANRLAKLAPITGGSDKAVARPGGAPLARAVRKVRVAARRVQKRKRRQAQPVTRAKSARKPPKGGKDFKALSASWRAAGKPGKWIDWVKSH
jgi:hypothetical protein